MVYISVAAWLKHENLHALTVKAGQTARWEVKIGGEPAPEITWLKNGQPIEQSPSLQIEHKKNDHTTFCILSAVRADCGKYTLKVRNEFRHNVGEDTETATLTVLDKPTKPRGPLDVSNVFEDCCDLQWLAPVDDGGQPIDFYQVEKLDTATGRWVPVTKVKDCKAHVDGLKKGQTYMFRVKAVNREGESDALQTDLPTVAKNPYGNWKTV